MALSGTLKTLSLSEIFQTLERSQALGVLRLISVDGAKDIVFSKGLIINVLNKIEKSNLSIAQRIGASGQVSDQNILDSVRNSDDAYESLSGLETVGVDKGLINETLEDHMLAELFDIFTWEQANFTFMEAENSEDDEIPELVELSEKLGVAIKTNVVLMESARRLDEWSRARGSIPNDNVILNVTIGSEERLGELMQEYPMQVVIPLINGQNSLDEIIKQSMATRMDVCLCVGQLVDEQLTLVLTKEQIVENAKIFEKSNAFEQAANLYRRALANDPDDSRIRQALASSLENHGDGPQAAGCYAELAMGYMREGDMNQACASAERAVSVGDGHSERQVFIQCLEAAGRIEEATEQMRRLAEHHIFHSQWGEARELCHQVLSVEKNDDLSLHLMSLGFIHTCDLDLKEREIACVFCNQVNSRNNLECTHCSSRLHKLCRNCHSETACSDHVCLFCGKSPHILESEEVDSGIFASINEEDAQHRTRIQAAVDLRNSGKLDQALAIWKDISQENSSNQQIFSHIRDLESEIHNQSIEQHIQKGNNFRRGRRFRRAVKSYAEALRILAPRDPRKPRLESILVATKAEHKRSSMVYSIAGSVLAVTLFLLLEPIISYSNYKKRVEIALVTISDQVNAGGGSETFLQVQEHISQLRVDGAAYGSKAEDTQLNILSLELEGARARLSLESIGEIHACVKDNKINAAQKLLQSFTRIYGPDCNRQQTKKILTHIDALVKERKNIESQLANASELYTEAIKLKNMGNFKAALLRFEMLEESPDEAVKRRSAVELESLRKQRGACVKQLDEIKVLTLSDLKNAETLLAQTQVSSEQWGLDEQWAVLSQRIQSRTALSDQRFLAISKTSVEADYRAYLEKFPGSRHQQAVSDRLLDLGNERAAKSKARGRLDAARVKKDWQSLYLLSKRFSRDFPEEKNALLFPLAIQSNPPGATVVKDGKEIGKTPMVYQYTWDEQSVLQVQAAGFDPVHCSIPDQRHLWRFSKNLSKSILFDKKISAHVSALFLHQDTIVACGPQSVVFVDLEGEEKARHSVGTLGFFVSDSMRQWCSLMSVSNQGFAVPMDSDRVVVYDWQGQESAVYNLSQDIESRPLIYESELFGEGLRVALSDGGLSIGDAQGKVNRLLDTHRVLSGPIVISNDFEQQLVFVSHLGSFIAYDESDSAIKWEQDSGAVDVSSLNRITENNYIAVLDDSRLVRYHFSMTGVRKVWDRPLKKALLADPKISDNLIYLPLKNELRVYDFNGTRRVSIPVQGVISAVSGLKSTGIAIAEIINEARAEKRGRISFYDIKGKFLWQKELQGIPQTLLVVENRVYVGTSRGHLVVFTP